MGKIVANKSLKVDAKQLACAHSSLILANNFAQVSEALVPPINQVKEKLWADQYSPPLSPSKLYCMTFISNLYCDTNNAHISFPYFLYTEEYLASTRLHYMKQFQDLTNFVLFKDTVRPLRR